jgi:signal transduction histidine kinase/ActR/RegA family two-component response regulator
MATPTRSVPRGQSADSGAARLFLASNRNFQIRLATAAVIALASLPLMNWRVGALWLSGIGLISFFEARLARSIRSGRPMTVWEGVPVPTAAVAVITGGWYTVFMGLFWLTGNEIARAFALAQTCISVLYVLLQYYARPRLFLVAVAPYLVGAGLGVTTAGRQAIAEGKPWTILTAVAALGLLCNLFWMARRQLAASREALRAARAQAQERGEAAEAANAAKSNFLATMSHEIRTPLNGVLGMAQAMSSEELTEGQREQLAVIRQSGEALLALLNDMLDLSKIEAGRLELERAEFDLGELISAAHSAFGAIAARKGLVFELAVARSAAGRYVGDPTRVRQIIYNLISNALKFTDSGKVTVTADREGADLRLTVADTGVGIPTARLGDLFERFAQADASTTRRYGGTGLGLSICRELAQLMGGDIAASSVEGTGSKFAVRLPLVRVGEQEQTAVAGAPDDIAENLADAQADAPLRVLAAEDNAVNQLVLRSLLQQIGVDPVIVEDGEQAFRAWAGSAWDVILMDMHMPVLDGLAATRRIRAAESAAGRPRTPIVALTADALSHQISECLAAGVDGHVSKPIRAQSLFQAIQVVLTDHERSALSA